MFAKIKDNEIIQFPYGYDDLQADNPYTRFTGIIDLKEIFDNSELSVIHGYELVEVTIEKKPDILEPIEIAILSDIPTKEDNKWMLRWSVEFAPDTDDTQLTI